jgi:Tol biopolymer transport system component
MFPRVALVVVVVATQLPGAVALAQEAEYPSDLGPAWSPDGRSIAFARYVRRDLSSIYLVRSDGTRLRRLYKSPGEALPPVWSPDSRSIAFTEIIGGGPGAMVRFRIVNVRRGTVGRPVEGHSPAWSPDGKRIAFVRNRGLAILDARTRRVFRLRLQNAGNTYVGSPDWSPDGRQLAVTTGGNRVSLVSAKGGRLRLLGLARGPRWSTDGRVIAAACIYSMRAVFLSPTASEQGCTDHAIHAQAHGPEWAPGGTRVAFSACWDPGGGCGIAIQARGSTQPRRIVEGGVYPSWAPGGKRLVFSSSRFGAALELANSDGSERRRLLRS